MWAPGLERPRLEVREQPGVLLGLLGDAVDRRPRAGLHLGQADRRRAGACAVAASIGLPCGQVSGWPSISSRRASTRGEMAPCRRIASSSDSAQPSPTTLVSSHSSSACRRKIASAAARPAVVSCRSRRRRRARRGRRRRAGGTSRWPPGVVTPRWRATRAAVTFGAVAGAGADAQREQVLLGGGGQVALVLASGHGAQDTGPGPMRRPAQRPARDRRDAEAGDPGDRPAGHRAPPGRVATSVAPPVAVRMSAPGTAAASGHGGRDRRDGRETGRDERAASRASELERSRTIGATLGSQVAANRAQPVISPASQPIPRAIGAQPMTARPTRRGRSRARRVEPIADRGRRRPPRSAAAGAARRGRRPPAHGARRSRGQRRPRGPGEPAAGAGGAPVPAALPTAGPSVSSVVPCHHEVAVWVGGTGRTRRCPAPARPPGSAARRRPGRRRSTVSAAGGASSRIGRRPRRARAWYSGPCLRGSAYSLGLSVQ